jgi:hypothetical protein
MILPDYSKVIPPNTQKPKHPHSQEIVKLELEKEREQTKQLQESLLMKKGEIAIAKQKIHELISSNTTLVNKITNPSSSSSLGTDHHLEEMAKLKMDLRFKVSIFYFDEIG